MRLRARTRVWAWLVAVTTLLVTAGVARAQDTARASDTTKSRRMAAMFETDSVLHFTLRANFRALHRNRTRRSALFSATITYQSATGPREVPLRVRSRGIWRLRNCDFPPILLNPAAARVRETPFARVDRARLVTHCRNTDGYEQYVLQEFQLYRIYNLLTPFSHRARLARVTYADSASGRTVATRYAFILEDDAAMAARNGGKISATKGAKAGDLDAYHDALVGVFQYMIANVDWSVAGLHNVMLVQRDDGSTYAVVHDFDYSGVIKTPYAVPDERLPIRDVRQRLFRGYCAPPEEFQRVFALFNEKKAAIYALYNDHLGSLIERDDARRAISYFDDFFEVINNPRQANDRIIRACRQGQ